MASDIKPIEPIRIETDFDERSDVRWRPAAGTLRNVIATLLVGVAIAATVWFFDRPGTANSQSITVTATARGETPKLGRLAPDFELTLLDGSVVRLSDYRGRPVWINFWASWCPPCRAENPDIESVYNAHKDTDGLVLLAPAIGESSSAVSAYMDRADLAYPVGVDGDTQIAANYRVLGIPTHIFIDREGIVREIRVGAMSEKTMEKKIAKIIEPAAQ